jgi:hypothetical protein
MDGLLFHPVLFKDVVVMLMPNIIDKIIAACNKIV